MRVKMKLPRTNNPVEGFHNALNRTLNKENPTLWNVLKAFQDEETQARLKMNHASRGERPKQPAVFRKITKTSTIWSWPMILKEKRIVQNT